MRSIFLLSAVLLLAGCASQGRQCTKCDETPQRASLLQRLWVTRPKPGTSSVPIVAPDTVVLPGTVEPVPAAQPQGTPAKVGVKPRGTRLRYVSLAEGMENDG